MSEEPSSSLPSPPPHAGSPDQLAQVVRRALHPRLLLACVLVAIVMVPVSVCLAALGIAGLQLSGGAADDTSLVVAVIAVAITDFWGAALVHALTRLSAQPITIAWTAVRAVMLVVIALMLHRLLRVLPFQLVLVAPAAYAGARIAMTQSRLRADARRSAAGRAALAAAAEGVSVVAASDRVSVENGRRS